MTTIHVENVGTFDVKRRTLRAEIAIGAEFNRLTEGQESMTGWFRDLCEMVSYLKIIIERAPKGWDLDEMSPEPESYQKIVEVYRAARATEGTKSSPGTKASQDESQGAGE